MLDGLLNLKKRKNYIKGNSGVDGARCKKEIDKREERSLWLIFRSKNLAYELLQ